MSREKSILNVSNVFRSYVTVTPNGDNISNLVLKGISFRVRKGEFIGIMGSSGCGKTTMLKTLGMLNPPDKGTIFYKGESTSEIYGDRLAEIRRTEIAFIFQDYYLLDSLTVQENIMFSCTLKLSNK